MGKLTKTQLLCHGIFNEHSQYLQPSQGDMAEERCKRTCSACPSAAFIWGANVCSPLLLCLDKVYLFMLLIDHITDIMYVEVIPASNVYVVIAFTFFSILYMFP